MLAPSFSSLLIPLSPAFHDVRALLRSTTHFPYHDIPSFHMGAGDPGLNIPRLSEDNPLLLSCLFGF